MDVTTYVLYICIYVCMYVCLYVYSMPTELSLPDCNVNADSVHILKSLLNKCWLDQPITSDWKPVASSFKCKSKVTTEFA